MHLPGSMYSVRTRVESSHERIAWTMNSGPLSPRMCSGIPQMSSSLSTSITSTLLNDRLASSVRRFRVYLFRTIETPYSADWPQALQGLRVASATPFDGRV